MLKIFREQTKPIMYCVGREQMKLQMDVAGREQTKQCYQKQEQKQNFSILQKQVSLKTKFCFVNGPFAFPFLISAGIFG